MAQIHEQFALYWPYLAVLLFAVSEALALIPAIRANGVIDGVLKALINFTRPEVAQAFQSVMQVTETKQTTVQVGADVVPVVQPVIEEKK